MARTVNVAVHAIRRDAFVDAAQRLIQTKGYEGMSIQDVLDDLGASRGAFYHYFDSKAALLDAVVERMVDAAWTALTPTVTDPALTALQKLDGMFSGIARWKGERMELVLAVLRVWRADDNAIVREKFRRGTSGRLTPLVAAIVEQGRAEGVFSATSSQDCARVLVSLIQSTNEGATDLYFARQAGAITFEDVESQLAAYREAFERILGLPAGSFPLIDRTTLRQWFG